MLFIGEKVGLNAGPQVDIAVDPLEGTTLCAKNMPGAIATMAMADGGTLLHAPDVYMEKIAIGPGYAKNVDRPRCAAGREHPAPRQGQGRAGLRHHRARARPSAPCRDHCGDPQHRRRRAPDHRRRRRRRDPHREPRRDRRRHLHGHRRRAGRRAGRGGAALHRRPDAVPADPRHAREARARRQDGRQRSPHDLRHRGHGEGRLPVRGHRRHHGLAAHGRQVPQGQCDRDRDGRDALRHRHRALHQGRAPRAGKNSTSTDGGGDG